ncbi:penicillin acylase family protein [Sulfitobacter pseudonitzschiae]|uniref:Penicillin acylase family protein n=1 Tax=Pseudosulfitobacter pseudonitzschiae TaxID=1402135 RepID=A0A9Q2NVH8_9RHOB|nr:penicillin acylase family protein [Pseudosulfitobacter pseudonitzschiae]MBM2292734.1 penicillin acylase family protein [Pseudosulfitobacter pseudonitzschiae]MBM2298170.1 penicillin acylase family protein [Pseudosulfitobacter pseudonitzschiae]MBM2303084.1 penicillin acylase family protein [Pseudosulfitobacter pseudonitzschiae]MBM2312867.1 penicillin acylase family protein [Pseudosulfitobacter pseudonitzschiae]MBM2317780.1 penicillin acylase family protein [Pseudosulfitobacter pseudonitzschia
MAVVFQWLVRLTAGLIVLAVLGVGMIYYLASRSLPNYDATLGVQGISAPAEIVRDNANVPHILAQTDADAFFALGFVHAQDRLWQMMLLRRTAQGRLSEVFGVKTVETDSFIRRLDIYRLAVQSVAAQSPRTLTALEAYSAGVNARIAQINQEALGRGAPEFFIFPMALAPWQPADSIAVGKLMALQLSGQLDAEVMRARMSLALPDPDRLVDILPDAPGTGVAALPEYAALVPDVPRYAAVAPQTINPLSPFGPEAFAGASNAWAAAPSRSASGGTLLANDPHLGFSAPGIWYLAHLDLAAGGVIGATIPGIPAVLTGRSDSLGWGLTSAYVDDQDLFIEELNPDNPTQYRTPDGWKEFETRKSIITIKDADPITLTLRWTDNGPVLPGRFKNIGAVTPPGHVAALSWTALSPNDTSLSGAVGLMSAQDVAEAINASEMFVAPAQNLTLADQDTIAMKTVGAVPRRDPNHQSKGRMPSFGYLPENRWQGVMSFASNPGFVAPLGGILGNTNNKTVERPFPNHISYRWGDTQRVQRWQRLMQARQVHTRDSFIEAQLDTVSATARTLLPLIGAELWFTGEAAPDGTAERQRQRALTLLADWNGEMNEHLPEPLIYAAWLRALQDRMVRDDIGPLANELTHVEPLFIERAFRDVGGASVWCDVRQSAPVETCPDMARMALDDALIWIGETYGTQLESLRWGDAHQAIQDHPVLGDVPVLRYFVNIRQSTSGGDNTLQRGLTRGGAGADAFENVHGAGYRGVYDFADPDSSVFIESTGQSGHFLSRHYDDMAQLWRRGEYIPMSLDQGLARAASVGITKLEPATQ